MKPLVDQCSERGKCLRCGRWCSDRCTTGPHAGICHDCRRAAESVVEPPAGRDSVPAPVLNAIDIAVVAFGRLLNKHTASILRSVAQDLRAGMDKPPFMFDPEVAAKALELRATEAEK